MDLFFLAGTVIFTVAILAAAIVRKKPEMFINLVLRFCAGVTGIYFINTILAMMGLAGGIGLNGLTVFTVSSLGLPGIFLMYGLSFYLV